ncbi:MAG: sensor histidine kinase [Fimbriimonadaceae bacterium]|nr:sensor histidine kinase [Fimbriimonadaceae bacterium]
MLHVLDVAMNAVAAGARTVRIGVSEDLAADRLTLYCADNGCGMTDALQQRVLTAFATTKSKAQGWVGFGLALLRGTCDLVGGSFHLRSRPGVGTLVVACLPHSHLDRPPLGNVAASLQSLFVGCEETDVCFTHRAAGGGYRVDTRPVRRELGAAYGSPLVKRWLVEQLEAGEAALASGRVER